MSDDEFEAIARQVAERIAAAAPPTRPLVPLSKLGQPSAAPKGNGHCEPPQWPPAWMLQR